jgi:hypothetical protein
MHCHHHRIAMIAMIPLALSSAARAEDAAATPAPGEPPGMQVVPHPQGRILNGHVFMPSAGVPNALVTTSFASYLVLGLGQTSTTFQVGDRTFSGNFDYAGVGSIFGYEHAFGRHFSARFGISETIFSGIDGKSVFAVGTQLQVGATIGVTASLPVGDSLRLALLFDVGSVPGLALTIGSGLQTIVDTCQGQASCDVDTGTIFGKRSATTVQPALAANWAPLRALGVTANAAYVHLSQKRNEGTVTGDGFILAVASDFDFRGVSSVPIGLMLQLTWTAPTGSSGGSLQHVTDFGGGIFYTGRENLALGLQLVNRRFAVQPGLDVTWKTVISTIGLRYYW